MKKRFLFLTLTIVLCLGLSIPALADSSATSKEEADISNLIIRDNLQYTGVYFASEGYFEVRNQNGCGLLDSNGNEVIAPSYDHIGDVSEGIVVVGKRSDESLTGMKYGFVDTNGNVIVEPKYDSAGKFSDGRAMVGIYSPYETADPMGGTMTVHGNRYGFIDRSGNEMTPLIYIDVASTMVKDKRTSRSDGRYLISYGGHYFSEGLMAVKADNGKWGMIDINGNTVIPFQYDGLSNFHDGLACFSSNGKEGAINTKGEIVIPATYQWMEDFSDGYAIVSNGKAQGIIDKTGAVVAPLTYYLIGEISEGMAVVFNEEGKCGYVDLSTGELAVPLMYDTGAPYSDGLALVGIQDHRVDGFEVLKYCNGYIDKTGSIVIPLTYDDAYSFSNGVALVATGVGSGSRWLPVNYPQSDYEQLRAFLGPAEGYYIDTAGNKLSIPTTVINSEFYGNAGIATRGKGYAIIRNPFYKETAVPNRSTVLVNGQEMAFDAYTINQNNYFKLRDLAKVLSGTGKQFEVTWDGSNNAINMLSGKPYTTVGGELAQGAGTDKTATVNTATVYLDGQPVSLLAYTINQNNYFKLRDVGQAFDFDVTWDGARNTIVIDTTHSYTAD